MRQHLASIWGALAIGLTVAVCAVWLVLLAVLAMP